jgi:peroxiredoxin
LSINNNIPNIKNILVVGVLIGIGLGAIIFAGIGLYQSGSMNFTNDSDQTQKLSTIPAIGKPAPDFALTNLEGDTVRLSDLYGKPVAINFWATWCSPCIYELPIFQKHFLKNGDRFEILAVNNQESQPIVEPFVDEMGLTFDILLDLDAEVAVLYQVVGFPTTYFIDSKGITRAKHIGVLNEDQFRGYLKQIGISE